MPFGKNIQKEVEKALYNYDKLDNKDVFKKHIDLALEYFKDRPHITIFHKFYFIINKKTFYRKKWFVVQICNELNIAEANVFRMRNDIVTRIIFTLAIDRFFKL